MSLHAEDLAGNTTEMDYTNPDYGSELEIRVLETTKPSVVILNPTQDAVLGSSTVVLKLQATDYGGSGLSLSNVVLTVNGVDASAYISPSDWTENEDNGTMEAQTTLTVDDEADTEIPHLTNGINTITVTVQDNDGNVSDEATVAFALATSGPLLEITTPANNLITNGGEINVTGKVKAGSEYTSIASITVNGEAASLVPIDDSDGYYSFAYEVTLDLGENTITIVATDSIGKTTTITRNVILDPYAPVIDQVVAEAVTVTVGDTIKVTFRVRDVSPSTTPEDQPETES